jgi:hypothetical protein
MQKKTMEVELTPAIGNSNPIVMQDSFFENERPDDMEMDAFLRDPPDDAGLREFLSQLKETDLNLGDEVF